MTKKETYRFRLADGLYGPVAIRAKWSDSTAVYRLSEVSPRYGVLSGYSDIENALRNIGAWPGPHLGVWFVRATDSLAAEIALRRVLKMCANRLAPFGASASAPKGYDDTLEDAEVQKRRAEARAKGLMPPLVPMPIDFAERPKGFLGRLVEGVVGLLV